jgi:hypothetical protein
MSFHQGKTIYRELEQLLGSKIIVYVTSDSLGQKRKLQKML